MICRTIQLWLLGRRDSLIAADSPIVAGSLMQYKCDLFQIVGSVQMLLLYLKQDRRMTQEIIDLSVILLMYASFLSL